MQRWALIVSLALNVLLVAALLLGRGIARTTTFALLAEAAQAEVTLQEYILAEIESEDAARVTAVGAMLRRNIQNGKQATASWRTAANQ